MHALWVLALLVAGVTFVTADDADAFIGVGVNGTLDLCPSAETPHVRVLGGMTVLGELSTIGGLKLGVEGAVQLSVAPDGTLMVNAPRVLVNGIDISELQSSLQNLKTILSGQINPGANNLSWVRLLGDASFDSGRGISTDSNGNVFITGWINTPNQSTDIIVAKYSGNGTLMWTQLLGGSGDDYGYGIAIDNADNVFITGYSSSSTLGGQTNAGGNDILVAKYSNNGTRIWVRLLGSQYSETGNAITTDISGNVLVSGSTYSSTLDGQIVNDLGSNTVIVKYSNNGARLWTRLFNNRAIYNGIATDSSGNIFTTGSTMGSIDGQISAGNEELVIIKYSNDGTRLWTRLLGGVSDDRGNGIIIDIADNIFITGFGSPIINGQPISGGQDILVAKFANNGTLLWTRLVSGYTTDSGNGITIDTAGNAYVIGTTYTSLNGQANIGGIDIVVIKYTNDGERMWTRFFGGLDNDLGYGIATDISGNVFITGDFGSATIGDQTNTGGYSILVAKLNV